MKDAIDPVWEGACEKCGIPVDTEYRPTNSPDPILCAYCQPSETERTQATYNRVLAERDKYRATVDELHAQKLALELDINDLRNEIDELRKCDPSPDLPCGHPAGCLDDGTNDCAWCADRERYEILSGVLRNFRDRMKGMGL